MGRAQEEVYFSRIQDSDEDLLGAILRTFNAAPKYNPRLLQSDSDSAAGSAQQVIQPCTCSTPEGMLPSLHTTAALYLLLATPQKI